MVSCCDLGGFPGKKTHSFYGSFPTVVLVSGPQGYGLLQPRLDLPSYSGFAQVGSP